MSFGEDKNKIEKIAGGSKTQLYQLYEPLLKADKDVSVQGHIIEQVIAFSSECYITKLDAVNERSAVRTSSESKWSF